VIVINSSQSILLCNKSFEHLVCSQLGRLQIPTDISRLLHESSVNVLGSEVEKQFKTLKTGKGDRPDPSEEQEVWFCKEESVSEAGSEHNPSPRSMVNVRGSSMIEDNRYEVYSMSSQPMKYLGQNAVMI
jgi:hypothetical protein